MADTLTMDTTTSLVVNNVARLDRFSGVGIVNLFSRLTGKLNFRWNSDADLNASDNDGYIRKAASESETVILAWGRGQDNNTVHYHIIFVHIRMLSFRIEGKESMLTGDKRALPNR